MLLEHPKKIIKESTFKSPKSHFGVCVCVCVCVCDQIKLCPLDGRKSVSRKVMRNIQINGNHFFSG